MTFGERYLDVDGMFQCLSLTLALNNVCACIHFGTMTNGGDGAPLTVIKINVTVIYYRSPWEGGHHLE